MQLLVDNTILLESNKYTDEIDSLNKYIITHLTGIFDYLSLYTEKMCKICLIETREELDELYKQFKAKETEKMLATEVPASLNSFIDGDTLYVLNYEAYTSYFKNSKATIDDYSAAVLADLVPIFQVWKFGKLSGNKAVDRGLAAFLSYDDLNCKVLNDSYVTLLKSDNDIAYGDFYKYLDNLLNNNFNNNQMIDLLTGDFPSERLQRIYDGYRRQFMESRRKQ